MAIRTRSDKATTVTKVKRFTVAMLAAATVTVGALAAPPAASAMPMTCNTARALARVYIATGDVFFGVGSYSLASYWYGKADGVMAATCG